MAIGYNPRVATDGLVLALDAGNTKSFLDASPQGQQAYTTSGTHSWTCPAGVYSVSAVVVGGGGGGAGGYGMGGGGGGLAYKNNISVTPGQSYTVVVGSGGAGATDDGDSSIWTMALGSDGGDSYFVNTSTVRATGGTAATSTSDIAEGGTNTAGDGGGSGGLADISGAGYHWAGGGAGGYSGDGGRTGSSSSSYSGHSGTNYYGHDGAGGGGGGGGYDSGHGQSGGGGGVGLLGEGANGSGGTGGSSVTGGGGGSGGSSGTLSDGGNYGGGGGSQYTVGGDGAGGAVRIIWGSGRSFPSTNTVDVTPQAGGSNNWNDMSGKGNNGTITGATFNSSNGGYLDFDGTNDVVTVDNSIRTIVGEFVATNSNPFSISVWFKPDTSNNNRNCIFSKANGFGNSGNIYLEYSGTNLTAVIRGLGNPDFYTSLSNNTWHEVTLCWDGTTFKSYVNGSFVSNLNKGTASSQNVEVRIGNSGNSNEPFAGQISNVKVYTKGLLAAEVLQNFNALKGRYGY